MKKLLTIFLLLISANAFANEYKMKCSVVRGISRIKRCENKEAVCYQYIDNGFQCKFK